jgi:hypothetical protein
MRALDAFDLTDAIGGAKRGHQAVQVSKVMDFNVDVEGVEAAVAVGKHEVDDIGSFGAQYPGHFA